MINRKLIGFEHKDARATIDGRLFAQADKLKKCCISPIHLIKEHQNRTGTKILLHTVRGAILSATANFKAYFTCRPARLRQNLPWR
jgi:ERCC4-type nuclease